MTYSPPAAGPSRGLNVAERTPEVFEASRTLVDAGTRFDAHRHEEDQLAWMASGAMELTVRGETWHRRGEHLAWIPAGAVHEMAFTGQGRLISVYAQTGLRPRGEEWARPRTLSADPLATSLLEHLVDGDPSPARRRHCRLLLADLLEGAATRHDVIALPREPRARSVAEGILRHPADARELEHWAAGLGVSGKTIGRAFLAETGQSFRRWRIQARLQAAAGLLAEGRPVQEVAAAVGYATPSGFIAAFSERFGSTPARYAQGLR
ncbi:AraC family transcriptional regulator [Herbiconiux sp. KACC 21604]|uniref:helix-turn-helix domain-containing protein n=1 Tax=unclassified Herbiconiux TaxID=2618217 RepID=UPI0014911ABE|nr:AraC family transcriptional regulator [Herbiconiux sp. SALV-R1]QJU52651.1 helix-turn-helix transcriptional regulator [Herbiconiux sp. SALV-R1]WPO87544.1 AraC family transcriptional regulator [Herbiconiux sp. KACC 21604]